MREEQHDRWLGFKREEAKQWLAATGLKNVAVVDSEEKCCGSSCCGGEKANITIFVASGEKQ